MWPFNNGTKASVEELVKETIEGTEKRILNEIRSEIKGHETVYALQKRIKNLREENEKLEIERDRKVEEQERRDREIEHKLGLHKKQVEKESEWAVKEATLTVKEELQDKKEKQFEKNMTFMTERFQEEVKYQRQLLEKVLERLPSAEIIASIGREKNGD